MTYIYPAEFAPSESGGYIVLFKDFELATEGEDLSDALSMAEEALTLRVTTMIRDGEELPPPSNPKDLRPSENEGFISLVRAVCQNELNEKVAIAV